MDKTTQTDLIAAIAAAVDLPKKTVSDTLEGFVAVATTSLNEGKAVALPGFGTFKPKHRSARQGRNPRTGEMVDIAASTSAGFTPAKGLKDALN